MILITGTARIRDGVQEAMRAAAAPMIAASRAEPGCHAYRYGFDVDDDTLMLFHEEYEDEAALAAHFGSDHLAAFVAATKELMAERVQLQKWSAEVAPFG